MKDGNVTTGTFSPEKRELFAKLLAADGVVSPVASRIPRRTIDDALELSFSQQDFWLLNELNPTSTAFSIPTALRIEGRLDVRILKLCFEEILRRHESLRTTFSVSSGRPTQTIETQPSLDFSVIDLVDVELERRELVADERLKEEAGRPFDLGTGPLFRLRLFRLSRDEHLLLMNFHHIVFDGWSLGVLRSELSVLYKSYSEGNVSPLAELPVQYADYAIWQRRTLTDDVLKTEIEYWRQKLSGLPPSLNLSCDRPSKRSQDNAADYYRFEIDQVLARSLTKLGRKHRCTPFMTLLAVFKVLLCYYTGQTDIVVGTAIAGRSQPELEGLIGCLLNTLLLRTDLGGNPSFITVLERVRDVAFDGYAHQDVPLEKVVQELRPRRSSGDPPLFQVMFVLENEPSAPLELPGLSVSTHGVHRSALDQDLALEILETSEGLRCLLEYKTELFDRPTIERLATHFQMLVQQLVGNPEMRLSDLSLLTPTDQHLLREWNKTSADLGSSDSLHELFERQVQISPEAIAVVFDGNTFTYRQLNELANRTAHYLRSLGVGSETIVGICLPTGALMVSSVLAVLKAGGAYLPLHFDSPRTRLTQILNDAKPAFVITEQRLAQSLPADGDNLICLDAVEAGFTSLSATNLTANTTRENLAYIIYTSGSTGAPKGVLIEHRTVVNFVLAAIERYGFSPSDRILQFANFTFDASIEEIFGALASGAALVIHPADTVGSIPEFMNRCSQSGITVLDLPNGYWHEIADWMAHEDLSLPPTLRLGILGSERASRERINQWLARARPGIKMINSYGPTEATVVATTANVLPDTTAEIPIGRPLENVRTYIVDHNLNPRPIGLSGELLIGGKCLARGYLDQAELTALKFLPDPFSDDASARVYRTGDLARYLPNGEIEFLGRIDRQIKVRGFRVEPAELESALQQHDKVRQSVVLGRTDDSGRQCLVAYVVGKNSAQPTALELLDYLRAKLPNYMMPSGVMVVENLPLTASGKVDRELLPAPRYDTRPTAFVAPLTPTEQCVAEIWQAALDLDFVGVNDDFFDLGGHSLIAIFMLSKIKQRFNVEIGLRNLFATPTVADLARLIEQSQPGLTQLAQLPPIPTVPRDGDLPVSIAQEAGLLREQWNSFLVLSAALSERSRLFHWTMSQVLRGLAAFGKAKRAGNDHTNRRMLAARVGRKRKQIEAMIGWIANALIPNAQNLIGEKRFQIYFVQRWSGRVKMAALNAALNEIIRRHEILRTNFSLQSGAPVQTIKRVMTVEIPVIELRPDELEVDVQAKLLEEIERPFDLESGPLLRLSLFRVAEEEQIITLVVHHFVCDGFSLEIFKQELATLYHSFANDSESSLLELPIQYADFGVWERTRLQGEVLDKLVSFWKNHLTGAGIIPELELPFARPRPLVTSYRGHTEMLALKPVVCASLNKFARERGVTTFMFTLTVLKILLHRYTGKEYIAVQVPFANRLKPETEKMIGWFAHTLFINTRISGNPSVAELLNQVRDECLGAYEHQEISFTSLFAGLMPYYRSYKLLTRLPRIPFVTFSLRTETVGPQIPGIKIRPMGVTNRMAKPGISLILVEKDEAFHLNVLYEADVYDAGNMKQMLVHFQEILEGAMNDPDTNIMNLPISGFDHDFAESRIS